MNTSPDSGLQQAGLDASGDPFSRPQTRFFRPGFLLILGIILLFAFSIETKTVRAAWDDIAQFIGLKGKPAPASANVLSEHEVEVLDQMTPQSQATLLLERSINHYSGANEEIAGRVGSWRGKIQLDQQLNSLFTTAINADDLRVRAAAIEVDLAARDLEKNSATIDRLEPDARSGEQGPRANALWDIGLLGNRGVEPDQAAQILLASIHDDNVNIRYWAVESLAYLGSNETINSLLEVLHDDPSPMIRERAACGLAQSGMLSQEQRRSAIPKLLDFAEDPALNAQTRNWIFQALRDITGQTLPHDAAAWRSWYNSAQQR
ncbi:MAG TPA: HEAT repeat domain-containing protein [Terriglobales bacterium]|nr:HEAT repeat domain-containing protein [Terriglobales bacterium]